MVRAYIIRNELVEVSICQITRRSVCACLVSPTDHFRVTMCLCFKTRLRDKFDLHENKPVGETHFHEWFRMKTRYDTEAKGNSTDCLVKS